MKQKLLWPQGENVFSNEGLGENKLNSSGRKDLSSTKSLI